MFGVNLTTNRNRNNQIFTGNKQCLYIYVLVYTFVWENFLWLSFYPTYTTVVIRLLEKKKKMEHTNKSNKPVAGYWFKRGSCKRLKTEKTEKAENTENSRVLI